MSDDEGRVYGYDEVPFATTVTGVATIQAWPGTIPAVPPDFTFRVKGLTYSGVAAGTVTIIDSGPFGTVFVDQVVTSTTPFARGYTDPDVDVLTIRGGAFLIASVVGTVVIAGIGKLEYGRR